MTPSGKSHRPAKHNEQKGGGSAFTLNGPIYSGLSTVPKPRSVGEAAPVTGAGQSFMMLPGTVNSTNIRFPSRQISVFGKDISRLRNFKGIGGFSVPNH